MEIYCLVSYSLVCWDCLSRDLTTYFTDVLASESLATLTVVLDITLTNIRSIALLGPTTKALLRTL